MIIITTTIIIITIIIIIIMRINSLLEHSVFLVLEMLFGSVFILPAFIDSLPDRLAKIKTSFQILLYCHKNHMKSLAVKAGKN